MLIPMLMNLKLSGMAFCGIDARGFGHDYTAELFNHKIKAANDEKVEIIH